MNNNLMNKIQVPNIYGELVDAAAPEPTIQFGVNGSNAKWGTELQYGMCGMSERTFIKRTNLSIFKRKGIWRCCQIQDGKHCILLRCDAFGSNVI